MGNDTWADAVAQAQGGFDDKCIDEMLGEHRASCWLLPAIASLIVISPNIFYLTTFIV